jgi:hypothetical protein
VVGAGDVDLAARRGREAKRARRGAGRDLERAVERRLAGQRGAQVMVPGVEAADREA